MEITRKKSIETEQRERDENEVRRSVKEAHDAGKFEEEKNVWVELFGRVFAKAI